MMQTFQYPNLFKWTRDADGARAYDYKLSDVIPYEPCDMSPCGMAFTRDSDTKTGNYIFTTHNLRLRHGVDYTLSLWVAANENIEYSTIYILGTGESSHGADGWIVAHKDFKLQVGGGYVYLTFTLPEKSSEDWMYTVRVDNRGTEDGTVARLYVADIMLVEGTEPRAWAPAAGEVWPE